MGTSNFAEISKTFNFPEISTYRYSCKDETKRFPVENPATGKTITTIQAGDEKTVDAAAKASQKAFEERWRPLSPKERSQYLFRCADELESHIDEIATLLCLENGKPAQDAKAFDCAQSASWYSQSDRLILRF